LARLPTALPPGVYKGGTQYQSKNLLYDAISCAGTFGTAPGERLAAAGGGSGKARAARAWKSNGGRIWLAVGTHSKL